LIPRLGKAVINIHALSVSGLTAPLLALTAVAGQAVGTFQANSCRYQVAELTVQEGSPLAGRRIADVAVKHRAVVLAHAAAPGADRFGFEVDPELRLAAGDRLAVCAERSMLDELRIDIAEDALPHVYWAGWLRRMGRVVRRTLSEIEIPVKIATCVLLVVMAASTLIYRFSVGKPWPEAFYRTVSIMATGADMRAEADALGEGHRIFVSVLRIAGAALIASFTALLTNYLLRARLWGALEVRRIPDSGHIIVCGLGNIGYQIVQELLNSDERVVVIEQQRDGRFMTPVRRLGVATIVGDATVLEILRLAHAPTCRAVVAATSNQLANLEIALLARELNPHTRVVVRLLDPTFADSLREAASIRFALAIPRLVAPAFVAALLGDRVQTVFQVHCKLFAALELVVQPGDGFLDNAHVGTLARDYALLPVIVTDAQGVASEAPMEHRLQIGDRLTVVTRLKDLQRLLRRDPAPG
jgi:Trk K+ transport system NAD-binding subunit